MIVAELKLFELLKAKIGEKEAEAFVQILESRVDTKFDDAKNTLATKEDIMNLRIEMERGFKDQLKWIIILMFGFASLIIALIKFV